MYKNRARIQIFTKKCKNYSVWTNKIVTPMLIEMGPEFHCFEGKELKTNVYKIGPEFQCL